MWNFFSLSAPCFFSNVIERGMGTSSRTRRSCSLSLRSRSGAISSREVVSLPWFSTVGRTVFLALLTFTPSALSGATFSLVVVNLPPDATRVVALIEGGGLTSSLRVDQVVAPRLDLRQVVLPVAVPADSYFHVRVIAFRSGTEFPLVLAAGGGTRRPGEGLSIDLQAAPLMPVFKMQPDNRGTVRLTVSLFGWLNLFSRGSAAHLWINHTGLARNGIGAMHLAPVLEHADGQAEVGFDLPEGEMANSWIQFGYYFLDFKLDQEVPLLVWPNFEAPSEVDVSVRQGRSPNSTVPGRAAEARDPEAYTITVGRGGRLVRVPTAPASGSISPLKAPSGAGTLPPK